MSSLFDPYNPMDYTKFNQPTIRRFHYSRELSTRNKLQENEYCERWEQMICQINNNFSKLLSKYTKLHLNPRCRIIKSKWVASSYHCSDITILDSICEKTGDKISYKIAKDSIMDRHQSKYMPYKKTYSYDGLQYYVCQSPIYKLRDIHIFRITSNGHYTIGLYYKKDNRFEYFDSGGFPEDLPNLIYDRKGNPHFFLKRRLCCAFLKKNNKKNFIDYLDNAYDNILCRYIADLFPDVEIIPLKLKNLQMNDEDVYCQSWVLLYLYLRFISPKFSTKNCLEFLNNLNEKEAYNLIFGWWNYIIYLNVN